MTQDSGSVCSTSGPRARDPLAAFALSSGCKVVRPGKAWLGQARQGLAWLGAAEQGKAGPGKAGLGMAWRYGYRQTVHRGKGGVGYAKARASTAWN
jgi:hypothetical protein